MFGAVVLTGNPTTTTGVTLTRLGNSQDGGLKADSSGVGFAYDIYVGSYTVSAGDTVSGSNIVGNTAQGATGGGFTIGSQIMLIGWVATTPNVGGSTAAGADGFLKFDQSLTGNYHPANAPGGAVTSFSTASVPGDFQLQTSRNSSSEFRVTSFRFNQDALNNNTYPMQTGGVASGSFISPQADLPFRTFGINVSAPASTPALTSQLIALNLSALNGMSFGGTDVTDFGPIVNFYMYKGNVAGKTGVVINSAPVPEPTTIGMFVLGSILLLRRRQR